MGSELHISTNLGTPIYRQLQDQIRRGISSGRLLPDEALPSVRSLAEQLVINPNTVARAYAELVREGLIESSQGRGFFISQRRQIYSDAERRRRLEDAIRQFVGDVAFLDFDRESILKALDRALQDLKPKRPTSSKD
jgi:GntR family transcriptional regulator